MVNPNEAFKFSRDYDTLSTDLKKEEIYSTLTVEITSPPRKLKNILLKQEKTKQTSII